MSTLRTASALGIASAGLLWVSCNTCPFQLATRVGQEAVQTIECCGASVRSDVTVPDVDDLEVDIANTEFRGETGRVDIWLTAASCEQLFDGDYPSSTPRCETLIGPVPPGVVSERIKVRAGRYRVFAQAYSTNTAEARFDFDVGVWGRPCRTNTVGP
jgi:hypothetical protein